MSGHQNCAQYKAVPNTYSGGRDPDATFQGDHLLASKQNLACSGEGIALTSSVVLPADCRAIYGNGPLNTETPGAPAGSRPAGILSRLASLESLACGNITFSVRDSIHVWDNLARS